MTLREKAYWYSVFDLSATEIKAIEESYEKGAHKSKYENVLEYASHILQPKYEVIEENERYMVGQKIMSGLTGRRLKTITCFHCGARSFYDKDVEHKYCGACHRFLNDNLEIV